MTPRNPYNTSLDNQPEPLPSEQELRKRKRREEKLASRKRPVFDPSSSTVKLDTNTNSFKPLYEMFQHMLEDRRQQEYERKTPIPSLQARMRHTHKSVSKSSGFRRMQKCRNALEAIDRQGWKRSFHQRQFHDDFLRACARVFWKMEGTGQFNRDHQYILEYNGWNHLDQEVLVSTPRRFGKTISVSMFAAAMIYSCPMVEISIYSTCKRISQKLLRNVEKFLNMVYLELNEQPMSIIRSNMEEIMLKGGEGPQDVRILNSYPSKVYRVSAAIPPH